MNKGLTALGWTLATGSLIIAPSQAQAQSVDDFFDRSRNVSVQSRPHPEYEAAGVRAGAFMAYPKLETSVELSDNIYARASEVSDTIFHIRPEISLDSNWNQHFLTAYARGALNRYVDNSDEDTEEFALGASGRVDVSREINLAAGGDYISTFEPRYAPDAPSVSVEPVGLDIAQAYLSTTRTAGRTKLSGRLDWRSYDYEDGRTGAGAVIDQDYRDRDVVSLTGRGQYAVSPSTAVFIQAVGNERSYDLSSTPGQPNRDSSGVEVLAGADFELSNLVRGEVAAGYLSQEYDEPAYDDVSGFGARASLEWFVSEITTVSAAAGRSIEDAANPGSSAFLMSTASLRVDHELLRNVILNGSVNYSDLEYEGIDRQDEMVGAAIGATYLVNRNVGLNASLSTTKTTSRGAQRDEDYTVTRLTVALVTQF